MRLSTKQQNALLTLYEREICKHLEVLYLEPDKGKDLSEFLPLNRISQLCEEAETREEFGRKLFKELRESSLAEKSLYIDILKFLNDTDHESVIHKLLACTDKNTRRSEFGIVLSNLDGFMKFTDPMKVLLFLDANPRYKDIVRVLKQEITRLEEDEELKKKLVLRTIPQLGQLSVYDVMFVIYNKCSQNEEAEARDFIERIKPKFPQLYGMIPPLWPYARNDFPEKPRLGNPFYIRKDGFPGKPLLAYIRPQFLSDLNFTNNPLEMVDDDRKHPRGRIVVCPLKSSLTELMMVLGTPAVETNQRFTIVDLAWDPIPRQDTFERIIVESVTDRVHMANPIILRQYQHELCQHALDGKNTIVTAPTGSGKTVIAANILKHHFQKARNEQRRAKALFMTPNSVILQQQASSLSSYLDHIYRTQIIQGADGAPVRGTIMSNDLIVATPQMIVNLCTEHLNESLEQQEDNICEEFFLTEFTIIVFDECHATQKNAPYSNLMKIYHRIKNTGQKPDGHRLPQIIGLTASLGVGSAKDERGAVLHIADLCANMDVKVLSNVRVNLNELRNFSPIIPDNCVYVPRGTHNTLAQFARVLSEMMRSIEDKMLNHIREDGAVTIVEGRNSPELLEGLQMRSYGMRNELRTAPLDKELEAYEGWVSNTLRSVAESQFRNDKTRQNVFGALQILRQCYWTLEKNNSFNSKVALEYLTNYINKVKSSMTQEMVLIWEAFHHRLLEFICEENGMITKVVEYLMDQNEQNRDFRAIIFVKTRATAETMAQILNERVDLKQSSIVTDFISGMNRSGEEALSKKVQQEKVEKFASGDIRVLVATSVAEEGLDIAKCNLVIKYNYATNEIAHVQRRGRGRALNSKCVLITNSERLKNQEDTNKNKENLMKHALHCIMTRNVNFERMVDEKTAEIWRAIQKDELDRANVVKAQVDSGIEYSITCSKCSSLLCKSSDIRTRNTQYFVCNPNFWGLVRAVPLSIEEREADSKYGKGKIMCRAGNCGVQLGRLIEVGSADLPCLAAGSITLKYVENNLEIRKTVKKWKEILSKYFTPAPIRNLDIMNMKNASGRDLTFRGEVMNPV